jgi:hypothetical protein
MLKRWGLKLGGFSILPVQKIHQTKPLSNTKKIGVPLRQASLLLGIDQAPNNELTGSIHHHLHTQPNQCHARRRYLVYRIFYNTV